MSNITVATATAKATTTTTTTTTIGTVTIVVSTTTNHLETVQAFCNWTAWELTRFRNKPSTILLLFRFYSQRIPYLLYTRIFVVYCLTMSKKNSFSLILDFTFSFDYSILTKETKTRGRKTISSFYCNFFLDLFCWAHCKIL